MTTGLIRQICVPDRYGLTSVPPPTVALVLPYRIEAIEWGMVYPVQPSTPIGRIRRRAGRYEAKLAGEYLGAFPTADAAAEAVWGRFLEQSRVQHEEASLTHGAYERHVR